jgi:acyl transferase domain-containing protein
MAMADAGVTGADYDYVEAHGTGTRMGDPIEVLALSDAIKTDKEILIGSVKGNLGHMNTAAAVPGLIKLAEMLWRQEMVPSLGAENPNTLINWEDTPFRPAAKGGAWRGNVAALSSFGIGGTNVHIILGRSPIRNETKQPPRTAHLYVSSAKTVGALRSSANNLVEATHDLHPTRVETTLLRRRRFAQRCFALKLSDLPTAPVVSAKRPVVLLFPGQGAAYPGMAPSWNKMG